MTPLQALNELPAADFAARLAGVYEHSPWIPERAHPEGPFADLDALHGAMVAVVERASPEEQLGLIRAHPDLAGRAALRGELTQASSEEQKGAGLDRLSPEDYRRFHLLNDRYRARFGFPFVLAVKGHDAASVLRAFETRLEHGPDEERRAALREIHRIARFRLESLLGAS